MGVCSGGEKLLPYETTPKWHGFLMIKLVAFQASGWAEQRTAEYRISNRRISKDGFALRGVGAAASTSRRLRSVFF